MSPQELSYIVEGWLFAHAQPLSTVALRRLVRKSGVLVIEEAATAGQVDHGEEQGHPQLSDEGSTAILDASAADGSDARRGEGVDETAAQIPAGQEPSSFTLTPPPNGPSKVQTPQGILREAIAMLHLRWHDPDNVRGVQLVSVGDGLMFRTNPRYAAALRALRDDKPPRLTRPALESLAVIAYRQPVTKPDIDHLRGVDSGGVVKLLLERGLIAVMGKREEPGRPLMYGTTPFFLEFFNLESLESLPSLKQFDELNDESAQALRAFEGLPSLKELSEGAKQIRPDDGSDARDLDDVVAELNQREGQARQAFLAQGVEIGSSDQASSPVHH